MENKGRENVKMRQYVKEEKWNNSCFWMKFSLVD